METFFYFLNHGIALKVYINSLFLYAIIITSIQWEEGPLEGVIEVLNVSMGRVII